MTIKTVYLVFDDEPLQHPLSVFVEDVGTQEGETLLHHGARLSVLLLEVQQHGEPEHLRLQLTQV